VREAWSAVWETFPELTLWQELLALLRKRCQVHGRAARGTVDGLRPEDCFIPEEDGPGDGQESDPRQEKRRKKGAKDDEVEHAFSQWARRWRRMLRAVLPGGEAGTAASWSDPEVRKLCAALWRDFADPLGAETGAGSAAARRCLALFRTEARGAADVAARRGSAPAEWAFVPAADLLLIVGEGLVGSTLEGVFADALPSQKRLPFASAIFQTMM